jgi:Transposase DDE domain
MEPPRLYRQLQDQLRQWVMPKDQRHLQGFAEIIAAILHSQSACFGKWIPYLGHRDCQARAHIERLSYFVHNEHITAERFYDPLLRHVLAVFAGESILLTLDTSMLWNQFCLIEVCCVWGGRSFTLAQTVIEHGSATVSFEDYQTVLECAKRLLPPGVQVTLLADRGFEHAALIRWLQQQQWFWAIRVKSDLNVTLANGQTYPIESLLPPADHAHLFEHVRVFGDIECHLAAAKAPDAKDHWSVLSQQPPSLQTFALYGKRFGGIEPHFKDYKSAAFEVLR